MKFQVIAVSLMITLWSWALHDAVFSIGLAIPTGLAIGAFRLHSIGASWRLFRGCVYAVLILVVALHPALWGATTFARVMRQTVFDPMCAVALFGIGMQLGAELNRMFATSRGRKVVSAIEMEFAGLLDRVAWNGARSA